MTLVPVVLFGGKGERLWPVSREALPKPFMKMPDGESLLCKTYRRALGAVQSSGLAVGKLLSVTNRHYYFMGKDALQLAVPEAAEGAQFMLEPVGRDTAPAIALAALAMQERYGPSAVLLVLASDHLIQNEAGFDAAVVRAAELAADDWMVTFGIEPDSAHVGYGYIEAGEQISNNAGKPGSGKPGSGKPGSGKPGSGRPGAGRPGVGRPGVGRQVRRFVEKPSRQRAEAYLRAGNFFWNSGMFCFKASVFLQELARCAPDISQAAHICWQATKARKDQPSDIYELPRAEFEAIPARSVDYAVMEKAANMAVLPSSFGWRDVGSWDAVRALVPGDANQNRAVGPSVFVGSNNNFVMSESRITALVGVDNLTVIDTRDALLVAHPDKLQEVKQVVSQLKTDDNEAYRLHSTVVRPWGSYTVLEEGPGFKIKRIEVKPGGALSLQRHKHRSEHWVVVKGLAKIINGTEELLVKTNESTFIPAGGIHRLSNPSDEELILIEVQSGPYLGEDDIERLEDAYNRTCEPS